MTEKIFLFTRKYAVIAKDKKSAIEDFQADLNNGFFSNLLDAPDWTFQEIDEDELEHYIRTP